MNSSNDDDDDKNGWSAAGLYFHDGLCPLPEKLHPWNTTNILPQYISSTENAVLLLYITYARNIVLSTGVSSQPSQPWLSSGECQD